MGEAADEWTSVETVEEGSEFTTRSEIEGNGPNATDLSIFEKSRWRMKNLVPL